MALLQLRASRPYNGRVRVTEPDLDIRMCETARERLRTEMQGHSVTMSQLCDIQFVPPCKLRRRIRRAAIHSHVSHTDDLAVHEL